MKFPKIRRYPKQIQVGESIYEIKFVKRVMFKKSTAYYGTCDPHTRIIRIKKGMSQELTYSTYFHELLHAFEFEYEIPLKHKTIHMLEEAFIQFLKHNA